MTEIRPRLEFYGEDEKCLLGKRAEMFKAYRMSGTPQTFFDSSPSDSNLTRLNFPELYSLKPHQHSSAF